MCGFPCAAHPCALPCNTLGIFTPSEQVVFLVAPRCRTSRPSVCRSRDNNLPHIVCHPAPPIIAQPSGRSVTSALLAPFAQEISLKKRRFDWTNVSSKPTYGTLAAGSARRARAGLSSHNASLGVRHADVGGANCTKAKPHVAHVVDCGALTLQCDGHTVDARIGGFPPTMSADVQSGCLELPRQGRPLLLGEGSGCGHSDVQPIQGSLAPGNQSSPRIVESPPVQPACATISVVQGVARAPSLDVEVGNEDNNGWDSSGSLQMLGSLPPTCFVKQLAVAHVPSQGLHGSACSSLEIVTPDGGCAPLLSHVHGTRPWGGGNNAAHLACVELYGDAITELVWIRIPSKKLVGGSQIAMAASAQTWVVGHVLENYTCLSSGRDLYDADFGDSYGHQTVLVGDCESLCDTE